MPKELTQERIPVSGPWITRREIDYVAEAAANAWYANANAYNSRFEKAFADYLGVPFAISLPSCTSALHLSMLALGIGPGDEVIVPDVTWIASVAPVCYVGATPVFADIDPKTWCLSAESVEECITPRTKAVLPVDLYGNLPDMDAICDLARRHNLAVIEDAAEAVGSEYNGRKSGSFGDVGTFSFHGSKTLTTGEGGMLVTGAEHLYQRCLVLRDHGRQPGDRMFFNGEVAYKYKMSSLQAALGLAQLERVEELVHRKREIFNWYKQQLSGMEGITLNAERDNVKNTYWMVTVVLDPSYNLRKERAMERLADRGIDTRPFFHPLSAIPAFRGSEQAQAARIRNRISYRISPYGINLPSGFDMTSEKAGRVSAALRQILQG